MKKEEQIKEIEALGNGMFRFIDMLKVSDRITEKDKKAMQNVLERQYALFTESMKNSIEINEDDCEVADGILDEDGNNCLNLYQGDTKIGILQSNYAFDDCEYEVIIRKKEKN